MSEQIIIQGDITNVESDCIVNAANSALSGGGGVDGAIHRAAGPNLLAACREFGRCPPGEVRVTDGYQLSAKKVIHAVGPVWEGGANNEEELLCSVYKRSLSECMAHSCSRIAFPNISCGAYRFPLALACKLAYGVCDQWLNQNDGYELTIIHVCFDKKAFAAMNKVANDFTQ